MPFPAFLSRASRCQKEFGIYIAPGHRSKEVNSIRVVIVGGGFAAVQFAKTLRSKLRASECEILLFNRENHDPLPAEFLRKETTYADAIKALNESASGHLLVLDEKQRFWGTLDRNDLYQII